MSTVTGTIKSTLGAEPDPPDKPAGKGKHVNYLDQSQSSYPYSPLSDRPMTSPTTLYSSLDTRQAINKDIGAISLVCIKWLPLGHMFIVVEKYDAKTNSVVNVVAHVKGNELQQEAGLLERFLGYNWQGSRLKTAPVIREPNMPLSKKLGRPIFSSKTWPLPADKIEEVLQVINQETEKSQNIDQNGYNYRFLGQFQKMTPDTQGGINCANWPQMILEQAGITNQGGVLIDFPFTQCLPGNYYQWLAMTSAALLSFIGYFSLS